MGKEEERFEVDFFDKVVLNEEDEEEEKEEFVPELDEKTTKTKFGTRKDCFDVLFEKYDTQVAKEASRNERKKNGYISSTLVYGEIDFLPFSALLNKLNEKYKIFPKTGGTFVDVGCGSGKAVFAAALTHDFDLCVGIEILSNLHEIAVNVLGVWRQEIVRHLTGKVIHTRFSFVYDDATLVSWAHADVVFMNSTCFDDILMGKLASQAEKLGTGVVVITATKPLPSNRFKVLEQCTMKETWGEATIFVQRMT